MVIQHMGHKESLTLLKTPLVLCLLLVSFFLANHSIAGQVTFTPSIALKQSYSDNILLAPKGQEESETVTEVTPAFSLLMRGASFNASVNYSMQNLLYKKENNRNETYNQLSATSTADLVADYLFFDVNANHSQQVVNADNPIGSNNIAVTNNTSNVSSYTLAPYFQHSFRNVMDASIRFSRSEVDYRRDELIDSTQTGVDVSLSSPTTSPGLSWGLNYLKQKNDFETGNDSEFKRGSVQLGYRFTQRTHAYASKGKDENTFEVANNQDISEPYWNAGFDWQPSSRDYLSLQYGERFFGHTTQFSWRHTGRRLNLTASYEEELSTAASSLLQSQQISSTNTQQNQPTDSTNSVSSQVFIKELGALGLTYTISKTSLSLNYSNDKRVFQSTGEITQLRSASFSARLRSSSVMTYVFGTRWSRNSTASTNTKLYRTNIDFSIERQLSAQLQGELSLSHGLRRSSSSASGYDENIVSLGITKTFN